LNERASNLPEGEVDITLDDRLGIFFPYYAKQTRPKLFDSLMKKQNTDMNSISAIPIFGLTTAAADYEVTGNSGTTKTVWEWIKNNNDIQKIEKTASSQELGKYMLQVERDSQEEVERYLVITLNFSRADLLYLLIRDLSISIKSLIPNICHDFDSTTCATYFTNLFDETYIQTYGAYQYFDHSNI
jgi:hypothetical protein